MATMTKTMMMTTALMITTRMVLSALDGKKECSTAAPVYLYVNLPWDEATGAMHEATA